MSSELWLEILKSVLILVSETPYLIAAIQLAVSCSELYFVRCCALERTGMIRVGKQGYVFIKLILKSDVLMFHS